MAGSLATVVCELTVKYTLCMMHCCMFQGTQMTPIAELETVKIIPASEGCCKSHTYRCVVVWLELGTAGCCCGWCCWDCACCFELSAVGCCCRCAVVLADVSAAWPLVLPSSACFEEATAPVPAGPDEAAAAVGAAAVDAAGAGAAAPALVLWLVATCGAGCSDAGGGGSESHAEGMLPCTSVALTVTALF